MSASQIDAVYGSVERADEGYPKLAPPLSNQPSDLELFRYQCMVNGVRDGETVKRLFREKEERIKRLMAEHAYNRLKPPARPAVRPPVVTKKPSDKRNNPIQGE